MFHSWWNIYAAMMRRQGSPAAPIRPIAARQQDLQRHQDSTNDSDDDDEDNTSVVSEGPTHSQGSGLGIFIAGKRPPVKPQPSYASEQRQAHLTRTSSSTDLQNSFSRPRPSFASDRAPPSRDASPNLSLRSKSSRPEFHGLHTRKHSKTQGSFEPTLPSVSTNVVASKPYMMASNLSASQIAAQAAMQHQSNAMHQRQRSQTVPVPQNDAQSHNNGNGSRRVPGSPPTLSLTEASVPSSGGSAGQEYRNGLLGGRTAAATTAANVAFPRSPQPSSPSLPSPTHSTLSVQPEKPVKTEKTKVKLFSRPGKINTNKEAKEKPMPSPSKLGAYAINSLQRNTPSTSNLAESSATSMYSMKNSSTSTIRQFESATSDNSKGEKEKHKHHFLSRQKHKLMEKGADHHLPLSSASSNSRPADPAAPSSLYNFNLPPSPAPTTTSFAKSMSGLDLRHGGRALRDKKKEEKERETDLAAADWTVSSTLSSSARDREHYLSSTGNPSLSHNTSLYSIDSITAPSDLGKFGLNNMTADDAWPFLRTRLLVLFEGEDLRMPIEDFNKLVVTHLTRCAQRNPRNPGVIIEDMRDLLDTGFRSLDAQVRRAEHEMGRESVVRGLVQMWTVLLEKILPWMQGVFLPLDLEWEGVGPLNTTQQFWAPLDPENTLNSGTGGADPTTPAPVSSYLDVRKLVLMAYRDTIILPRFESLKQIFSRLSLESIHGPSSVHGSDTASYFNNMTDEFDRPGTAMSLDPAMASYNSQGSTLLDANSVGTRSRGISNVSFGSNQSDPNHHAPGSFSSIRGVTVNTAPSATGSGGMGIDQNSIRGLSSGGTTHRERLEREANFEDGRHVTEIVGRMLQCMSVLASVSSEREVGDGGWQNAGGVGGVESAFFNPHGYVGKHKKEMVEELGRALKLNWLGRGRTGRNRRGWLGAKGNGEGRNGGRPVMASRGGTASTATTGGFEENWEGRGPEERSHL